MTVYVGGCSCGFIRFEAGGEAANPHSCSCELCQRHSGAASLAYRVSQRHGALDGRGR